MLQRRNKEHKLIVSVANVAGSGPYDLHRLAEAHLEEHLPDARGRPDARLLQHVEGHCHSGNGVGKERAL